MKRLTILFLFIFTSIAQAQEETAPWPPDPSEIFAQGVEVVSVESTTEEELNPWEIDNEERVLRYYDSRTDEIHEYRFPAEVESVFRVVPYLDDTVFINLDEHVYAPTVDYSLMLDLNTGNFLPPPTLCDEQIPALPFTDKWRYVENVDNESDFICSMETGELISQLPEGYNWHNEFNNAPHPSPDERWLFLLGWSDDVARRVVFYSYNIANGHLNYLGELPDGSGTDFPHIQTWVSNREGVLQYGS